MSEDNRATLTVALWFLSALVLGTLFITAAAQGALTTGHMIFAAAIMTFVAVMTPVLLRGKATEAQQEKSKGRLIDTLLHDLSDDDLLELKKRLSDDRPREEAVIDYLGDDGELVKRS